MSNNNPYSYKWFEGNFIVDNLSKGYKNILTVVTSQAAIGPPFGYTIQVDVKATENQKRDAVAQHLRDIAGKWKLRDKYGDPKLNIQPNTKMIYFITKIESRDKPADAEFEFRGFIIPERVFKESLK
jgi:hypothetical protein